MTKVISLFTTIPFGLFVAVCATYSWLVRNYPLSSTLDNISCVVYGIGLILSWWFNRSRVFFIIAVIALSHFALSDLLVSVTGIPTLPVMLYPVIRTLLPINIFVFSLLQERGIFNAWGLGRFGIIGFQLFYISLAIIANDYSLLGLFYKDNLPEQMSTATDMSQIAVWAYVIIMLLSVRQQLKQYTFMGNTFMMVLATIIVALYFAKVPLAKPLFFSTAGIMLILAVIQDSYAMAYLDELTGLPARRALMEELLKLRGEYTIAMVDIDFFKKFNDTYGHDTGDEVLRLVASVLKKVGGGGKAFRYGGEEFAIIFPYTTSEVALPLLEKLRVAVAKTPYAYYTRPEKKTLRKPAAKQLSVTISIGVAERGGKNQQTDEVIKAADAALYRAKENGRNCVSK